jgi:hypothetical protein
MSAWEGLHCQMDSLVALQIVIAVECLLALVAFVWTIVLLLLTRILSVHQLMLWILHVHASD